MERIADILLVMLGWALGAITPGITEAIQKPKRRAEILSALRTELTELRYKLALVAHNMRGRTGSMTSTTAALVNPILLGFRGDARDTEFQETFSKLLAVSEEQYFALQNRRKGQGSPYPVRYGTPFLESQLQNVGLFPPATQERILRVRSEFHLFNEQVDQARMFHDRTYTLTGPNHSANDGNYETSLEKLAYRAEATIRTINALLGDDGNAPAR